jgi:hypothetical protein
MKRRIYGAAILARCTEMEREGLHIRARAHGISLSRYVIVAGLLWEVPLDVLLDRVAIERQEQAIFHVRRMGANINQIARRVNAEAGSRTGRQITATMEEAQAALTELRETFRDERRRNLFSI